MRQDERTTSPPPPDVRRHSCGMPLLIPSRWVTEGEVRETYPSDGRDDTSEVPALQ